MVDAELHRIPARDGAGLVLRRRPLQAAIDALPASLPALLRRVYAARGVGDADTLSLDLARLPDFRQLADIDAACDLIEQALTEDQRILVVGDFDADGATATALAVHLLRAFGGRQVDYLVPDRARHGYGLSPSVVEAASELRPQLIITVDNGIASHDGVAAAHALGCRVLVTDHHLPPPELPAADAIVNPNRVDCPFPDKALAGVGVIFYVMLALRARLRERGWFRDQPEPVLADYLDLVALGTVADVVPLTHTNRVLVGQGLKRIRRGRTRPGIAALAQVAGRELNRLVATDIGFGLAPRLNAAGRLDNMALGVECLLAGHAHGADSAALVLEQLNAERRERQSQMQDEALASLAALDLGDAGLPSGLCLHEADWHEGIVGLVAGRIRERYHRPVVAFARAGAGGLKGSARSVPGVHIRDVLANVATAHPGLVDKFGGHGMAAGLSLAEHELDRFRDAFAREVDRWVTPAMLDGIIDTDGPLTGDDFSLDTARALREGGPWGAGFPEPAFDGEFRVLDQRIVGERHLKLTLMPAEGGAALSAIAFNQEQTVGERIHAVYRLDVNRYQAMDNLQLVITAIA